MKRLFERLLVWAIVLAGAYWTAPTAFARMQWIPFGTSLFYQDSFNGTAATALTSHTANIGGGYTIGTQDFTDGSGAVLTGTGGATGPVGSGPVDAGGGYGYVLESATPPSADYTIVVVLNVTADNFAFNIVSRTNAGITTGYGLLYASSTGFAILRLTDYTSLGTSAPAMGTGLHTLTLTCKGSTITAYLDGTLIITATDATITAAGYVCIYPGTNATTGLVGGYVILEAYARP